MSKVEGRELLTLDLVLVEPSFADVWATRAAVEWEGRRASVVSVDGLVKMKRLAGRDQDLLDIKNLTGARDGRG